MAEKWWRVKVSFKDWETSRRRHEEYAFPGTKAEATERAIAQLGPDWESEGKVESVTAMAKPPWKMGWIKLTK